ncbi:MAG: NnrS family protein, partial [Gammaproteobacteria bacterium]|nr:NnrS family protein [Gammaproteobacteria bacterium]
MVIFSYGFRPFFLLAGLWAIVPMLTVWFSIYSGQWPAEAIPLFTWHGHEMIFGFAAAAIAGFLLTAVPSWTGTKAVSGFPLIILAILWVFGRIEVAPFWSPASLPVQSLSVAFFPMLAVLVGTPLVRNKNFRNLPILLIVGILFVADFLFQGAHFGWFEPPSVDPLRLAINVVLLLVAIIGGRIVPAFTNNALVAMQRAKPITSTQWLDRVAIIGLIAILVGDLIAKNTMTTGLLAGFVALVLGFRMTGWRGQHTLDTPLLWVLHLGYCWLVVGLVLKAAWLIGGYGWSANWMHALTIGAYGTMVLGVTSRAGLGHTGRPLVVSKPVVVAYLFVSVAAVLRVWGPSLLPDNYWNVILLADLIWSAAFALFLLVY